MTKNQIRDKIRGRNLVKVKFEHVEYIKNKHFLIGILGTVSAIFSSTL